MNRKIKLLQILLLVISVLISKSVYVGGVQNATQLQEIATISPGSIIFDLHVIDNLLFFIDRGGLHIYDISNISEISLIGEFPTSYAHDLYIDISKDIAYILDPKNGLIVLDVQVPQNLTELNRITEVYGTNFYVKDELLFLGDEVNGLRIFNISNSSDINCIASWNDTENNGHVGGVFFHDPYVFLSLSLPNSNGPPTPLELQVLDITNLDNISEVVELFDTNDDYAGGAPSYLKDNLLIISDYSKGLKFFDFSTSTDPSSINTFFDGGEANGFKVVNNSIFVADGLEGLEVLDITDITKIIKIGSISFGDYMARIDIVTSKNQVYLGGVGSGIKIIEYSILSRAENTPAFNLLIGILIPIMLVSYRKKASYHIK